MGTGTGYERGLSDKKWKMLIGHIKRGDCTPFIGSGACKTLPKGGELAELLAKDSCYPLDDKYDLQKVSQFIAIDDDVKTLRHGVIDILKSRPYPDFNSPLEPHSLLADLDLPIYITTNYDDFMYQALKRRERDVKTDFTRWANEVKDEKIKSILFDEEYKPTPEQPLVYHLHGNCDVPESMVLTEEDYLDFLINVSKDKDIIPPAITTALSSTALLFIGYSLNDSTLRFIVRGLMRTMTTKNQCRSIAVQIEPDLKSKNNEDMLTACDYLDKYFDVHFNINIDVYWGKAENFVAELRGHWDKYSKEA